MENKPNFAKWTARFDSRHGNTEIRAECDACRQSVSILARAGASLDRTAFWHCGFSDRPRRKSLNELRTRGDEWLRSRTLADEVQQIENEATAVFSQREEDRSVALGDLRMLVFHQGRRARR